MKSVFLFRTAALSAAAGILEYKQQWTQYVPAGSPGKRPSLARQWLEQFQHIEFH